MSPRPALAVLLALAPAAASAQASPDVPAAHFDRDAIVAASSVFRSLADRQAAALGPLERDLSRTDSALASLDLSLALTRGAVDEAQHELWKAKLAERSTRFGSEFAVIQEQLDSRGLAYEQAFEAALSRALAALAEAGRPAVECAAAPADPFALPGTGGRSGACQGADVSAEIAAAWDGDAALLAALDAVDGESWAPVTTYSQADAPLALAGGTTPGTWVFPADLVEEIPEAIEAIDETLRRAGSGRSALMEARASVDPAASGAEARVEAIRARAQGLREWSEAAQLAVGRALLAAVERARSRAKKAGWVDVGVCLDPPAWGGCEGANVTDDVAAALVQDKKLARELVRILDGLGEPDVSLP